MQWAANLTGHVHGAVIRRGVDPRQRSFQRRVMVGGSQSRWHEDLLTHRDLPLRGNNAENGILSISALLAQEILPADPVV